ncbi:hypothetical protein CC86DRAFT_42695 [Ophiobolus disseminans]|uniref:Uncharacterized protein n=1 Tax=Ophiobolus disseminans TaxID=1469910 RepID=A0A6A6ZYJ8_9PLEO|nr:hypothetical protein CC86DRAFT_42695 [Ophiobolus disseminans]
MLASFIFAVADIQIKLEYLAEGYQVIATNCLVCHTRSSYARHQTSLPPFLNPQILPQTQPKVHSFLSMLDYKAQSLLIISKLNQNPLQHLDALSSRQTHCNNSDKRIHHSDEPFLARNLVVQGQFVVLLFNSAVCTPWSHPG